METTKKRSDKTSGLDAAVMAVMEDVDYVKRDGQNKDQNYKYATAEAIVSEIRASALKHKLRIGISYTSAVELQTGQTKGGAMIYRARVSADVTLRCGDEFEIHTFFGDGSAMDDKALAKAKTGCLKQALRQIFLIETGIDDPDTQPAIESHPPVKHPSLPADVQAGFDKLRATKNLSDADYLKAINSVLKANQGDLEAVRAYLTEKGAM